METGAKIGLAVLGIGIAVAAGFGIYYATQPKGNTAGNAGSGGGLGSGSSGNTGVNLNIDQIKQILGTLADATKEKFPLRVGMYGPNIKSMQNALINKFGQTAVKANGIFDIKTATALKNTKYITLLENTIDDNEFLDIIDGVKKTTGTGADGSRSTWGADAQQGDSHDFWKLGNMTANYPII